MRTYTVHRVGKQKRDAMGDQRYRMEISTLPGQSFGPFRFRDISVELQVTALIEPVEARNLILDAFFAGKAEVEA